MSNRKYSLKPKRCCWTCCKLKKSRRIIEGSLEQGKSISVSAPSIMDAIAGYYCNGYWFGDKPDPDEMLCGGRDYESYTHNEQITRRWHR